MSRTIRSITARLRASSPRANTAAEPCSCGTAAPGSRSIQIRRRPIARDLSNSSSMAKSCTASGHWCGWEGKPPMSDGGAGYSSRSATTRLCRRAAIPSSRTIRSVSQPAVRLTQLPPIATGVWHSNREDNEKPPIRSVPLERLPGARKGPMPESIKPQLAALSDKAPEGDEWLHEIKYDGYRLLARIKDSAVRLITRGGLDWTAKFSELAHSLGELP